MSAEQVDEDFKTRLFVTVTADKIETEEICAILRGLLFNQGQSNGQNKKNKEFKKGCTVDFGTNLAMKDFMAQVEKHLSEATSSTIAMKVIG